MIMVDLKTTFSEGDVFSAGSTVDNDKLNGITNEVNRKGVIHRKVYSSAEEVTTGNNYLTDTEKTFNLTAPVNSVIIGINILMSLKNSNPTYSTTSANVKLVGTNLGTLYCIGQGIFLSSTTQVTNSPTVSTADTPLFYASLGEYSVFSANINKPIKILDTTTAVTFRIARGGSSATAYLKDAVIEIIYVEGILEDA